MAAAMKKYGYLLLIMSMGVMLMSMNCARAAGEISAGGVSEELIRPLLSSITLLEGAGAAVDINLRCQPAGSYCNSDADCCPHTLCRLLHRDCAWCPSLGDSCGLTWACCSPYRCDGAFNGHCY